MVSISERKISEIRAYVTDAGVECVPVYNFGGGGGAVDPALEVDYIEWLIRGPNATAQGISAWAQSTIGTGASIIGADASDDNIPENYLFGWAFNAGTSVSGRAIAYAGQSTGGKGTTFFGPLGVYKKNYIFKAPSSVGDGAGDDIKFLIGWGDGASSAADPTSYTSIYYDSSVSTKIQLSVKNNSALSITTTPSSIDLTADQIYHCEITVYDNGGTLTAELRIGGELEVTITTNVPNSQAAAMGDYIRLIRSSATATVYKLVMLSHIRTRVTYPGGRFP